MKNKREILTLILTAMMFSAASCSSGNTFSENSNESLTETSAVTEYVTGTPGVSETAAVTDAADHVKPKYTMEKFPIPENMHGVEDVKIWNGGLLLNGPEKNADIGFEISVFRKDGQQNKVLVSEPGPADNMTVFVNAVYSDGVYIYAAGQASSSPSFSEGSFIFRYSISEKKIQNIKYYNNMRVRDMTYDRNKDEFLLLTWEKEIVSVDMEFEITGKICPQDKLPSDTDLNLNPEYISVDSSSNIYLSCGKRINDYNEYDAVNLLVLDSDYGFKDISEIRTPDGFGSISCWGISSLSDGSTGLFYEKENSLYVRRYVDDGTDTEDIVIMDNIPSDVEISCGRSNSDYVLIRRYPDNRKGSYCELWNVGNASPETVIDLPEYVFAPNTKETNPLENRYCLGDTMFAVISTTNGNGDGNIYACTDFSGEILNSVVQERYEMSAFSVTDSGSILFAYKSGDDGAAIKKKTETGIIDILETEDFNWYDVSDIIEMNDKYIVVFKSSWYRSLYDDIKTVIRVYSDEGEVLGEAGFTSVISIVSISDNSDMPELLIYDNAVIYSLVFDTQKGTYEISERSDVTDLFLSGGLIDKESNRFVSERNGGKYDVYITRDQVTSGISGTEVIYGYNASDNTLTEIIDTAVFGNDIYRDICVSDSDDIYVMVYKPGKNNGEVQIFKPSGTDE